MNEEKDVVHLLVDIGLNEHERVQEVANAYDATAKLSGQIDAPEGVVTTDLRALIGQLGVHLVELAVHQREAVLGHLAVITQPLEYSIHFTLQILLLDHNILGCDEKVEKHYDCACVFQECPV